MYNTTDKLDKLHDVETIFHINSKQSSVIFPLIRPVCIYFCKPARPHILSFFRKPNNFIIITTTSGIYKWKLQLRALR